METTTSGTETKHTPGPWVVNRDRRGAGKLYIREARVAEVAGATAGRAVAQVTAVVGFEQQVANADLIASAPSMRETLALTAGGLAEILAAVEIVRERAMDAAKAADSGGRTSAVAESLGHIREALQEIAAAAQSSVEGR